MTAIFWKEMADHLGRRRFLLTFLLILFGFLWGMFILFREVQGSGVSTGEFLFLSLFTNSSGVLPPVLFYLGFFGPLVGIALGFDAINSERTQGTLAKLLSQPIHRDAVFNGKFLAGLTTLGIVLTAIVLSIVGMGMFVMGYAPQGEEIIRIVGFSIVTVVYLAFWLAMAMTCSIFFRNAVTSALVSLGLWLMATFLIALLIAPALAELAVPEVSDVTQQVSRESWQLWISRISPSQLFNEAAQILLNPEARFTGVLSAERASQLMRVQATPISAGQSLQLVLPHIVVVFSMVAALIGVSYTKFLREEIRS